MKVFRLFTLVLALALAIPVLANISSQTNRAGPYTLSVLPATVSVVFPFQQASDIMVLNTGQSGTSIDPPTVLTLNSDYTVTGGGYNPTTNMQSGNVVVNTGGAHNVQVNDRIVIIRNVPFNQLTSFTSGVLTAAAIEKALDKTATISQQLAEAGSRTLRFQPGELIDGTLSRTARKSKVLGFDSNGNISFYAFQAGTILPQSIQGTANQVLVNGSFGTPVTGAATLTTPQDIGTTSSVQFGKMGINTAPVGNTDLLVNRVLPGATAQASVIVSGSLAPPPATDLHPNAFRDVTNFVPTMVADAYCSFDAQSSMGGTVNLNHYRGYQARFGYYGSGTIGEMSGYMTANFGPNGPGNVTFLRSFYVSQPTISGGATVGQFDGIYMDQLSNPTGNVNAIYIAGNNRIFMAGGQIVTSDLLTPINTNNRVDVTFDQTTQHGIGIRNKNATATGYMIQFYNNNPTQQGSIQQANSTTVAFNTTSDARLKTNVRPMRDSGKIIDAMQPRLFDWRWGGKDYHGFVAQELFKVYPEAVSKGDAGDEIKEPWSVDYSKLTPVLVSEVQDLRRRTRNLELIVGFMAFFVVTQAGILAFRFNRKSS